MTTFVVFVTRPSVHPELVGCINYFVADNQTVRDGKQSGERILLKTMKAQINARFRESRTTWICVKCGDRGRDRRFISNVHGHGVTDQFTGTNILPLMAFETNMV